MSIPSSTEGKKHLNPYNIEVIHRTKLLSWLGKKKICILSCTITRWQHRTILTTFDKMVNVCSVIVNLYESIHEFIYSDFTYFQSKLFSFHNYLNTVLCTSIYFLKVNHVFTLAFISHNLFLSPFLQSRNNQFWYPF